MIGVIAHSAEHNVVREFFELFKTPWEFYQANRQYEVLICAGGCQFDADAKLIVVYAGQKLDLDDHRDGLVTSQRTRACVLAYQEHRIPIYGNSMTFGETTARLLQDEDSRECVAYISEDGDTTRARVGYDLFSEIRTLLTAGQPLEDASIPTLELHIAFLRDLIRGCGISFVEIPPVPDDFRFIACLTHDVDHPSVRQQKLDHTLVGFLLRAVFGSVIDACLGRASIRDVAKNWAAAIRLPFVYIGLAKDFWRDFDVRYSEAEKGFPSTFFVIPRKNYPGKRADGSASSLRAVRYEAKELADTICRLTSTGHEVGLHGIDAWLDSSAARVELEEIRRLTGISGIGVRMHWLYYNEKSPVMLEKAGAAYDSTIGYNETVGYRAGTTQAYKPIEAERLVELPLHAMDTALFYLSYLALSPRKASLRLRQMVDVVEQYGGCLTINWHDRSLAPERLWGNCYRELIEDLKQRGAWFSTAGQAVSWFQKRRSAVFESDSAELGSVRVKITRSYGDGVPALRLRIHKAQRPDLTRLRRSGDYVDVTIDEGIDAPVPAAARQSQAN